MFKNRFTITKKTIATIHISLFLCVFALLPISESLKVKQVQAGAVGGPVMVVADTSATGIKTMVESTISAISDQATALGMTSLVQKELWWDGIFGMAAKIFLRQVVNSIVTWINSGFQGSPAFVTDLQGFLRDTADAAVGQYIYEDDALNFLCSPFKLDIKIALATEYSQVAHKGFEPQCTLSDVTDNVEGFLDGNFEEGGWKGWFEITQNPVNTPTGAYLAAKSEMYARIINAQGTELTKLDFGDGFFSMEVCDVAEQASGAKPNCTIGTPGSVIANSINKALGAPQDELIAADEVNEIFNALFSQLAQQAISGVYGLLGLGGSGYSNNSYGSSGYTSYLEAISEGDANSALDTSLLGDVSPITESLSAEKNFLDLQYQILSRVDEAKTLYDDTAETLELQGCTMGFNFPREIADAGNDAQEEIPTSLSIIQILTDLETLFNDATTVDQQLIALDQYKSLKSQGLLTTEIENTQVELYLKYTLETQIAELEADINAAKQRCDRQNN